MTVENPKEGITKSKILLVDDHPFIIEGYKNAITRYEPEKFEFLISQAKDCRSAYEIITNPESNDFEIAFLDISMPAYDEKEIFSGEDLAKLIKEYIPNCKIILLTMFTELLKIKTIIRTINPSGLIIKNDLTFDELLFAFDKVKNNEKYYSHSVEKMLVESSFDSIEIDEIDKQILFHLSKGTPLRDIPFYLPLTLSVVEKRIRNMKELLKIEKATVEELLVKAKSEGLYS